MVSEGQLLWTPSPEFAERSNVAHYMTWLRESHRIEVADYEALLPFAAFATSSVMRHG